MLNRVMFVHVAKKGDWMGRVVQAIHNIADRVKAERIQSTVQTKRENGNNKNFRELIEEELQKELSIEPLKED